jgi:hypothetical protein
VKTPDIQKGPGTSSRNVSGPFSNDEMAAFTGEPSSQGNRLANEMVVVRHPTALFADELWVVDERLQLLQVDVAGATGTGTHFASVRYDVSCLFGHIDSPF